MVWLRPEEVFRDAAPGVPTIRIVCRRTLTKGQFPRDSGWPRLGRDPTALLSEINRLTTLQRTSERETCTSPLLPVRVRLHASPLGCPPPRRQTTLVL